MRDQSSSFSCPTCREALIPISARDRYEFAFGCAQGHVVGLDQLFEDQAHALGLCFERMIETWEKSIGQMAEGARVASRHGSQDLAQRLGRRIIALEERVRLFRNTFLEADPRNGSADGGT